MYNKFTVCCFGFDIFDRPTRETVCRENNRKLNDIEMLLLTYIISRMWLKEGPYKRNSLAASVLIILNQTFHPGNLKATCIALKIDVNQRFVSKIQKVYSYKHICNTIY